jgi:hypothetical protein
MFSFNRSLFFANFTATLVMLAVIWWTQLYTYPSFARVAQEEFTFFHARYSDMISYIVILPMLVELTTSAMLLFHNPDPIPSFYPVIGILLLAVIWLSTFLLQVPMHEILGNGFDAEIHQKLVATNWIRTIIWTARGFLLSYLYFKYMKTKAFSPRA